jgi:DNA transformation protein and related proteins
VALDDPEEIRELFSAFGPISVRRMFSGAGLFAEGVMFALRIRDDIFLKADAETIPALKAEGSQPFTYETKKRRVVVNSLWRLPDRLLDDPEDLANFARAALKAAHRAAAKKSRPARQKTRKTKR